MAPNRQITLNDRRIIRERLGKFGLRSPEYKAEVQRLCQELGLTTMQVDLFYKLFKRDEELLKKKP